MEDNKKDFLVLKAGWNEAIRKVLIILDKKYNRYKNMYSVKQDIEKLLDTYDQFDKNDYSCEILKYYEDKKYGFVLLNCIDKIEGYYLDLERKTFVEMSEVDCLFDLNNLSPFSTQNFKNKNEANLELEKILSNFKKAED